MVELSPEKYWRAWLKAAGVVLAPPERKWLRIEPRPPPKKATPPKKPRVVSRRRRHKRRAAAADTTPTSPAPKVLSADERLALIKASAPRPRPPKKTSTGAGPAAAVTPGSPPTPAPAARVLPPPPAPQLKAPKPSAPEKPAGRERESLGIGQCSDCRRREPLFRHRFAGLCRNCHPFGGQLDAA